MSTYTVDSPGITQTWTNAGNAAANLRELYAEHLAGRIPDYDRRWLDIQQAIQEFAEAVVRRRLSGFYGEAFQQRVDDVAHTLLAKFIRKQIPRSDGAFTSILFAAGQNDLISSLRRSRSVTCQSSDAFMGEHGSRRNREGRDEYGSERHPGRGQHVVKRQDERVIESGADLFESIRQILPPFRMPQYVSARDGILAYFVGAGEYPTMMFATNFHVPRQLVRAVHNASVIDINTACMRLTTDAG